MNLQPLIRLDEPPRLAILGASVRAAAVSARRAGYAPVGVDLFADLDLRRVGRAIAVSPFPQGCFRAFQLHDPTPWCYTGGLENYPKLVDRLAGRAPLWGNPGPVLRQVRDPHRVAQVLTYAGLPAAEVRDDPAGLPQDGSWLSKPLRSSAGRGIQTWTEGVFPRKGRYLQRRIPGIPVAAVFTCSHGKATLLGLTEQLLNGTGDTPFGYAGSLGPLPISHDLATQLTTLGDTLAERFSLQGLVGVDGVLGADGFVTIEINPRFPASVEILERTAGFSAMALHILSCGAAAGKLLTSSRSESAAARMMAGKAIVYAPRAGRVSPYLCGLLLDWSADAALPLAADIPAPHSQIPAGAPIATVFADGPDRESVMQALRHRVRRVERQYVAS